MYYFLYQTTNKIDGKFYIGAHSTKNLNDGYFGSGKYLKRAINKYGIENFKRKILQKFNSKDEMYKSESIIVNEKFVSRKDTYNIKCGGHGSWDYLNKFRTEKHKKNISKSMLGRTLSEEHKRNLKGPFTKEHKKNLKIARSNRKQPLHTEDTKRKMSESHQGKHIGKKNSQFGTMWIYNLELKQNKKIKKIDLIPDGWIKGRKIK